LSFDSIEELLRDTHAILLNLHRESPTAPRTPIALVGNKTDKEAAREVSEKEGRQLAEKYGAEFFETSARDDKGIYDPFIYLLEKIGAVGDAPSLASEESATALKSSQTDRIQWVFRVWYAIQSSIFNGRGRPAKNEKDLEMGESGELDHREASWWLWIHLLVCGVGPE
jgi:hypothetical protein